MPEQFGIWLRTLLLITGLVLQTGWLHAPALESNQAELISSAPGGLPADSWSDSPSLSNDGRLTAFVSLASNLTAGDSNQAADVFVYDRQAGETRRVSLGSQGEQGNGWSYQPAISGDGSSLAFTSLARNWVDSPYQNPAGQASVYWHDLASGETRRISQAPDGSPANGWSGWASISADGQLVAYASLASNLTEEKTTAVQAIYLYDQSSYSNQRVSLGPLAGQALHWSYLPAISGDGRFVAYLAQPDSDRSRQEGAELRLLVYDRISRLTQTLDLDNDGTPLRLLASRPALSNDGSVLAFAALKNGKAGVYLYRLSDGQPSLVAGSQLDGPARLRFALDPGGQTLIYLESNETRDTYLLRYDLTSGKTQRLGGLQASGRQTSEATQPALSNGGQAIAFTAGGPSNGLAGVYLLEDPNAASPAGSITGWVTDSSGRPLAGVRVGDSAGHIASTDRLGIFRLPGRASGSASRYSLTIAPGKKGYSFSPVEHRVTIRAGEVGASGLGFTASPDEMLESARADMGMPYSLGRGCPSPFRECGGPFSGFYSGDCTDLVLDAYRKGLEINLQFALELDFQANPQHYYRWRNARSSQDMWRYFAYTGQLLAPQEPYLPGDIVFFDWEADGEMDHVAVISEVNSKGYPRKMIDATGKIEENPGGLATELEWQRYHDQHTYGHARWQGLIAPASLRDPAPDWLLVAVDGPGVTAQLAGTQGDGLPANSLVSDLVTGQLVSINAPLNGSGWYFLEVSSPAGGSYQLGVQTIQAREITSAAAYERQLAAGASEIIAIQVQDKDGKLIISLPGLGPG